MTFQVPGDRDRAEQLTRKRVPMNIQVIRTHFFSVVLIVCILSLDVDWSPVAHIQGR